jgi:ElaB/YqjD/DUF883 family membrane-anchored ribosome-binding protein
MSPEEQAGAQPSAASDDRTPEEIRADIERTREELGDTVEALAAKTDVKAQAQERANEIKQAAQAKRDDLTAKAKQISPNTATEGAQHVASTVQRKPVPFAAVGAFAAGLLIGWLVGRR